LSPESRSAISYKRRQLLSTHPVFTQSLFLSPSPSRLCVDFDADRGAPSVGAAFIFGADMLDPFALGALLVEASTLSVPAWAAMGIATARPRAKLSGTKLFMTKLLKGAAPPESQHF
jgi:hypothetical protein